MVYFLPLNMSLINNSPIIPLYRIVELHLQIKLYMASDGHPPTISKDKCFTNYKNKSIKDIKQNSIPTNVEILSGLVENAVKPSRCI